MKIHSLKYSLSLFLLLLFTACGQQWAYQHDEGPVFGTFYHIQYQYGEDLESEILDSLHAFDASLSMFNDSSVISRVNRNEAVMLDPLFLQMMAQAEETSRRTHGAFDITVKPLVEYWGFGKATGKKYVHQADLDSIRQLVGYDKIAIRDGRVEKTDARIMLDASAIAKGQGCDVVADVLQKHGITNYLVEIGGEIVCQGLNAKGQPWAVGINKPIDDPENNRNELERIVQIGNGGMATSGNYRQFYIENGQRRAHTIDPRTGQPAQHDLLSATVVSHNCMRADAYATAFMVLGADSALEICRQDSTLECFLICGKTNDTTNYEIRMSDGFHKFLKP